MSAEPLDQGRRHPGIFWCNPYPHVAATTNGRVTCRVVDILRVRDDRVPNDLIGPEDIVYWPSTDLLWPVTEHPSRDWCPEAS